MKKLLLATAVATLSITAAQAAPTVYGKAALYLDYTDTNDSSSTELNSVGSRIGVKGSEGLTANTDLVYQLEYGVDVDADTNYKSNGAKKGQFYSRDTYLGLSNKQYGTLVAGRLTAIDDNINYVSQTVGQYDGFNAVSWDGERANNAVAYFSPDYSGLQFMGMYVMDENNGTDLDSMGIAATTGSGWGAGVNYTPANQPFRAGATYIQSGDINTARVSGDYKLNPAVTVGALYQMTDLNTDDNENMFAVSGAYKTATPWTAYAQAEATTNVGGNSKVDAQRLVLGGKYGFNANTTGHIYAGYANTETDGQDDQDGFGVGAGLEYKF